VPLHQLTPKLFREAASCSPCGRPALGPLDASPAALVRSPSCALAAVVLKPSALQDLFGVLTLPDALLEVLLFIQSIQFDGREVIARHHALDPVVLDYG
jgi:hypothetical protein